MKFRIYKNELESLVGMMSPVVMYIELEPVDQTAAEAIRFGQVAATHYQKGYKQGVCDENRRLEGLYRMKTCCTTPLSSAIGGAGVAPKATEQVEVSITVTKKK